MDALFSIIELFDFELDIASDGPIEGLLPAGPDAASASYWDNDAYITEVADVWKIDEAQWYEPEYASVEDSETWLESSSRDTPETFAEDSLHTAGEHLALSAFDAGIEITVGDPRGAAEYWSQQQSDYSCAVAAQQSIINQFCDPKLTETQLAELAEQMEWYDPETGTAATKLASLLEWAGFSTDLTTGAEWNDLAEALNRGDSVLVCLDANEVYSSASDVDGNLSEYIDAGHAVRVTGMGVDAEGREIIFLSDPGVPDGMSKVAYRDEFINAWQDFGRVMVAARPSESEHV
jgi:hypothetical protein